MDILHNYIDIMHTCDNMHQPHGFMKASIVEEYLAHPRFGL